MVEKTTRGVRIRDSVEVFEDGHPGDFSQAEAQRVARRSLLPARDMRSVADLSVEEIARTLKVPAPQVEIRRRELSETGAS